MHTQQTALQTTVQPATGPMTAWFDNSSQGQIKVGHTFSTVSQRILNTHEHLFMEGDAQTHIYQVLDGVVGVYKLLADGRRQIVTFCYPGDLMGLDQAGHFANHAEALSTAVVRCIPQNAIDSLVLTEPGFGQALLKTLSTELAETRDQLLSLGRKSALEKVATFLVRISNRNTRFGLSVDTLHIPMTRSDIADYLGLTIETVSRNFTKLKVSRTIRLRSNSVVDILDADRLESIANEGTALYH